MNLFVNFQHEGIGKLKKKSELRSKKNASIYAITLGMRAAVAGGLYEELAYTLSDLYIQEIEEMKNLKMVERTVQQALLDFASRVSHLSVNKEVTRHVKICREYIYDHIYEVINSTQFAEMVGLTSNYLSSY